MTIMKRWLLFFLLMLSMVIAFGCSSPASKTQAVVARQFKTWKTIKLGTYASKEDLFKALMKHDFRFDSDSVDMLRKISVAKHLTQIELVQVTSYDLGFTKFTRRDAIYDRAKELGLDLVPAEVGPQLRLAYTDQPLNEWVVMAMEPITLSNGFLCVFRVGRYVDGRWLDADFGDPRIVWFPENRWVFARRKH